MGSSVTAGKDRHINYSFPSLIGPVMNDAFNSIGIKLVIRNVAMANNPCIPYDLCVKTFTGHDADIIHWEQSYNCDTTNSNVAPVLEQFLRQSIVNKKNHPVVVFSESDTPNWSKDQCVHKQANRRLDKIYSSNNELNHLITRNDLTSQEKELLSLLYSSPNKIPTSFNKGNLNAWASITPILQDYKTLGIQLWNHGHYVAYKCRGPYVPDWDCCNGYEWHPSIRGHELRAAHYAYFCLDNEIDFVSYDKDTLNQCIQSVNQIIPGSYILTIKPRNESNIMIAYLLLP
eukprot:gene22823-29557_t